MKITLSIELTSSQIELLKKLKADNREGFDDWACEHSEIEDDDMIILCTNYLAESILGEQFYISGLGLKYLENIK